MNATSAICQIVNPSTLRCFGNVTYVEEDEDVVGSQRFFIDVGLSLALLVVAGVLSGLSMGLFTLDPMNVEILKRSGPPHVQRQAAAVAPLVKRHHLVLVTMLLIQAAASEALPIFLDRLVGPIVAVALSVSGVVVFAEIIPNALFSRHGLAISARLTWVVYFLIAITFPVSYPVSVLLDCMLGHEDTFYRRAEIKTLINMHAEAGSGNGGAESKKGDDGAHEQALTADEANLIRSAIDLSSKTVADLMTPIDDVFMLDVNTLLSRDVLESLVQRQFSRIPVFRGDRQHVIGVLLLKQLVLLRPDDNVPLASLPLRAIQHCPASLDCYGALDMFQISRSHLAVVTDANDRNVAVGCVSLEDIIEELLDEELTDESEAMVVDADLKASLGVPNRMASVDARTVSLAIGVAAARRMSTVPASPAYAMPRVRLTASGAVDSIRGSFDPATHHSVLDRHHHKGRGDTSVAASPSSNVLDPHHAKGRRDRRQLRHTTDGEKVPLLKVNDSDDV